MYREREREREIRSWLLRQSYQSSMSSVLSRNIDSGSYTFSRKQMLGPCYGEASLDRGEIADIPLVVVGPADAS